MPALGSGFAKGGREVEFAKLWVGLCAAYPQAQVGADTLDKYYEFLAGHEIAQIGEAFRTAIQRCKFWPSIAELTEILRAQYRAPATDLTFGESSPLTRDEARSILGELLGKFQEADNKKRRKREAEQKAKLREQAMKILGVKA